MLSKEQFERIEKDIKEAMEEYTIRAKMLGSLDGTDEYGYLNARCGLDILMSTALRDELLDYARKKINDSQIVMDRLIHINTHPGGGLYQGEPGFFGKKDYYDGIFCFSIDRKIDISLCFLSSGFGNYYSRNFNLVTYESDKLEWKIRMFQKSRTRSYDEEDEVQRRGRRY